MTRRDGGGPEPGPGPGGREFPESDRARRTIMIHDDSDRRDSNIINGVTVLLAGRDFADITQ